MRPSRRTMILAAAGTIAAPAILSSPASAAEFNFKPGSALPDGHPLVIRSKEAVRKVADDSAGRLKITIYNNNTLGQDTSVISQAISGALEMLTLSVGGTPR